MAVTRAGGVVAVVALLGTLADVVTAYRWTGAVRSTTSRAGGVIAAVALLGALPLVVAARGAGAVGLTVPGAGGIIVAITHLGPFSEVVAAQRWWTTFSRAAGGVGCRSARVVGARVRTTVTSNRSYALNGAVRVRTTTIAARV